MAKSTYQPIPGVSEEGVRIQARIATALDALAADVPSAPALTTFITLGHNGAGPIGLAPIKNGGGIILARATAGARVVAVINLTGGTNLLASFEPFLSKQDQIVQTDTANLSAQNLMIQVLA